MSDTDAKRAANRAAFPDVAKIVDEFREAFGDGVRAVGGAEGGRSFGAQPNPNDAVCVGCNGKACAHPDRARMFCGHRMAFSPNETYPIETFGFGMGRRR